MDPWTEFVLLGFLKELLFFTVPGIIIGILIGFYLM
jgi:hypothetical protein